MKKLIVASALAATCFGASAEGFYIGAGFGQGSIDFEPVDVAPATLSEEDSDSSFKVFAGYEVNKYLAVELGYQDMGTFSQTASFAGSIAKAEFEGSGLLLDVIGKLPLNDSFSLFAKAGFARTTLEVTETATGIFAGLAGAPIKETETNFRYGLGAQIDLAKQTVLRFEYERTADVGEQSTTGESDIDYLGVSFAFKL